MTARLVYDAQLEPILGSTFQPTGFPDLGAATFDRKGKPALLVESVQSMANRLEATTWDSGADRPVDAMTGIPYVEVLRHGVGEFLTSSRLEAHRLFSAFVRDSTWDGRSGDEVLLERMGAKPDTPLDIPAMARAIMALDPFSLLHGVFFAGQTKVAGKGQRVAWPTQPKFTRAISAVIEAHDVTRVVSGGRKSDRVRHRDDKEVEGASAEGYGSVPFHRTEWTAGEITASFVVDLDLIRSYGLPQPATDLLETLALWEISTLLSGGMRLRAACDLELVGAVTARRGEALPEAADIDRRLRAAVDAAADVLGDGKPITVTWEGKKKGAGQT